MHAKIALGAVAALAVVGGIAIYTRSEPHGELPQHAEGSATPHLDTAGGPHGGGSGSAVEKPWLSQAATEQIVGKDGALGPLFDGVVLGGPAPADAVRARIAAFAKANDVAIDFEVVADKLVAVRLDVTFGGCCGYEGADKLGLRLQRPGYNNGDGTPRVFANAWSYVVDGIHARVDLRVNRVRARWEHVITAAQLLERAEALVGAQLATVQSTAGDRVQSIFDGKYLIEVPFEFTPRSGLGTGNSYLDRYDLGIIVTVEGGVITEAVMSYDRDNERIQAELDKAMRARWGPRHETDGGGTWRTRTHRIELEYFVLTIRKLR